MQDKVLLLDKSVERYKKIADRHVQDEDFSGALGFLFSAQKTAHKKTKRAKLSFSENFAFYLFDPVKT